MDVLRLIVAIGNLEFGFEKLAAISFLVVIGFVTYVCFNKEGRVGINRFIRRGAKMDRMTPTGQIAYNSEKILGRGCLVSK